MGQYYIAVSLTKKEYYTPFGLKMMEHSWLHSQSMMQVEHLLSPGNQWHKTRIVWAGDYADPGLFKRSQKENLYSLSCNNYKIISRDIKFDGPRVRYIVNHTKKSYIDLTHLETTSDKDWIIHPLPLLTSSGCGRGGGDYSDDGDYYDCVGTWAGDVISSDYKQPRNMNQYINYFKEPD